MLKRAIAAVSFVFIPLLGHAGEYMRTEYVTVQRPRQECWNEQVAVTSSNYGGAIIGGLAGGIIGNQVGGGNGRTVATAVGAATGALVGDRISGSPSTAYKTVRRCQTVYDQVQVPTVAPVRVVETVAPVRVVEKVYYAEPHEPYCHHGRGWHKGWYKKHHWHDED